MTAPRSKTSRAALAVARFFAIGLFLFAVKHLVAGEEPPRPLVVNVAEGASDVEVDAAIDEAILVDVALRAGLAKTDAVVRMRMLERMALVEDVSKDPAGAVDRAIAMGLPAQDGIARARLADSARRMLEQGEDVTPTDDEIAAHIEGRPEVYREPGRVTFRQIFLSRDTRGARLEADVDRIGKQLAASPRDASPVTMADPWPWTADGVSISVKRLDAMVGEGFGARVSAAEIGAWSGPLRSSFGVHFVYLLGREGDRVASPGEVRARATETMKEQRRDERLRARLASLRGRYRVTVEAQ